MVVAADVFNLDGQKILSAGATLTERSINLFKEWGILEVEILAAGEKLSRASHPGADPEKLSQIRATADRLFCRSNRDHPAVKETIDLFITHRLNQSNSNEAGGH